MIDLELKKLKDSLWHSADVLRSGAHLAANKYGQPILGLIFLRYADILYKQQLPVITTGSFYLRLIPPNNSISSIMTSTSAA